MVWLRLTLLVESCASKENVLKNLARVVSLPNRRKDSFDQFYISFHTEEIKEQAGITHIIDVSEGGSCSPWVMVPGLIEIKACSPSRW